MAYRKTLAFNIVSPSKESKPSDMVFAKVNYLEDAVDMQNIQNILYRGSKEQNMDILHERWPNISLEFKGYISGIGGLQMIVHATFANRHEYHKFKLADGYYDIFRDARGNATRARDNLIIRSDGEKDFLLGVLLDEDNEVVIPPSNLFDDGEVDYV